MSVQRAANVSDPRCQGAFVRLSGVKVSCACEPARSSQAEDEER